MRRPFWGMLLWLIFVLSTGFSCYYYRLEQKLDSENQEWLRRVGYIITSEMLAKVSLKTGSKNPGLLEVVVE